MILFEIESQIWLFSFLRLTKSHLGQLNSIKDATCHDGVEEESVKKDIEENKLSKILNPSKLDELPESWNVNYALVWNLDIYVHIDVILCWGPVLHTLTELVMKSLISFRMIILKELLQVRWFNLVKVVVVVYSSDRAAVRAWQSVWLPDNQITLRRNLASVQTHWWKGINTDNGEALHLHSNWLLEQDIKG